MRRLKFLRLLHVMTRQDAGYQVVIDGPMSLFESATKYGLAFGQVLTALEGCERWKLTAEVRWGKERAPLTFKLEGDTPSPKRKEVPLPGDVEALQKAFETRDLGWRASRSRAILEVRGVGLSVPDLVLERTNEGGTVDRVYLEVMGYWSRDAVWKRVELAQAGLEDRILFAVSSRLRVSEEVLSADAPSGLYVYKGVMNARAVAERATELCARSRG
jgi:uncharacterized protein